jgi:DNA helicase HerA-like ATPase
LTTDKDNLSATKTIEIGTVLGDGVSVSIPLAMMNRHGLIAGATGTGKTRTLQLLAEGLSAHGVPVFLADVKGDLAGMSQPARGEACPTEFFGLSGQRGTQVRTTVGGFGDLLLGKVLDLTDAQQGVLSMVFAYCDDNGLPLFDLNDLRSVLLFLADGKDELKEYGGMSSLTVGVLLRKLTELERQGAGKFFGRNALDVFDLIRTVDGQGVVNILSLVDMQDQPRLYAAFLMWLLGQFYDRLPEVGDSEKPKCVFFFDEAHLLFNGSSPALVQHVEQIIRLIRSKGVGVFFITQTPKDVSPDVLSQLGNRVQHALRAFTPADAKNIKGTAATFPLSTTINVAAVLTSMGTGEALVSVLDPRGVPTPVVVAKIATPRTLMAGIRPDQYTAVIAASPVAPKYADPNGGDFADDDGASVVLVTRRPRYVFPAPRTSAEFAFQTSVAVQTDAIRALMGMGPKKR